MTKTVKIRNIEDLSVEEFLKVITDRDDSSVQGAFLVLCKIAFLLEESNRALWQIQRNGDPHAE